MQVQDQSGKLHRKHFRLLWKCGGRSLSERGPAKGRAISRPRPNAAEIAVIAMASTPHAVARASLITACPKIEHPTPWIK